MKNHKKSRGFGFESLETRWTMAGNIKASLTGSTLELTGDDLSNHVQISGTGVAGQVLITGIDGTKINGSTAPLLRTGITSSIIAKLKAGNDSIDVRNIIIKQDLIIEGNQGRDTVFVGNARIGDDLLIYTHENNDEITLSIVEVPPPVDMEEPPVDMTSFTSANSYLFGGTATGVYVGDQLEIDAGEGSNEVGLSHVQVNGNAFLTSGGSNDFFSLYYVSINKNLNVVTNGGSDELYFSFYCIKGDLRIDTARGHDSVNLFAAVHNGQVNIYTGLDDDEVILGGGAVPAGIASAEEVPEEPEFAIYNEKNLFIDTNNGYDTVVVLATRTRGNVTILTGAQDDTFVGVFMINYKDILVDLGAGNDVFVSAQSSTGGNYTLIAGQGNDEIVSVQDGVNKKFTLDLGSENDTAIIALGSFTDLLVLAGSGNDTVIVYDTKVVKKAQFQGGSGKDRLDRSGTNSFGSQSVSEFEELTNVGA